MTLDIRLLTRVRLRVQFHIDMISYRLPFKYNLRETGDMYMKIISFMALIVLCNVTIGISKELNSIDSNNGKNTVSLKTKGNLVVNLNDDLLSLRAEDVPVEKVAEEIFRISGIKGWIFDGGREKITMEFKDIPLQKALVKILKNRNYGLFHDENRDSNGVLHIVKSKQSPSSDSTDIVSVDVSAKKYRSIRNLRKSGKHGRRQVSKDNVLNAVETSEDVYGVGQLNKQEVKNFLKNFDADKITSSLVEAIDASISEVSSADVTTKVFESLTTSGGTQTDISSVVTEQQPADTLSLNINMDELNRLMSAGLTK